MRCLNDCNCNCNEGGCACHDREFNPTYQYVIHINLFYVQLAAEIVGGIAAVVGLVTLIRRARR